MRVVIYGHTGTVGAQLYRWLSEQDADDIELAGVSLDRQDGDASEPDWAFLCLPTPTVDGQQDLSAIDAVCDQLGDRPCLCLPRPTVDGQQDSSAIDAVYDLLGDRPCHVVIRSTVLPGTCARIQAEHPEWYVYHWPEFLSASTAWQDFCEPRVFVVGHDIETYLAATWHRVWGSRLPIGELGVTHVSLETAETIKYAHNLHGAMQVIYANLLEDMMLEAGNVNKDMVTWALVDLGYIKADTILAYWNVYKDGYRGYGGACFPKDVDAVRGWLAGKAELLDGMAKANARLRGES